MRDLFQHFRSLRGAFILFNPHVRVLGLHPQALIWAFVLIFFVACICVTERLNVTTSKALVQDQQLVASYKEQLTHKTVLPAPSNTNLVQELPRRVVPELVIEDSFQFSAKHDVKLLEVSIQNDALVPDRLGQIHYNLTLRGSYPAIKELLQSLLDKHVGLVVDRLLIRKSPSQSTNVGALPRSGVNISNVSANLGQMAMQNSENANANQEAVVVLTQWLRPEDTNRSTMVKGASS